jgi:hypothetical protein
MTVTYDNTCGGIMVTMDDGGTYAYLPPYCNKKNDAPVFTEALHNYFMWQAVKYHPEYFATEGAITPNIAYITEKWGDYKFFKFGVDTIDAADERYCALKASPLFGHIITVRFTFEFQKEGETKSHFAGETLKLFRTN